MTTRIYIFRRQDRSEWAEYVEKCAVRQGQILDVLELSTRPDYERYAKDGHRFACERVKALAERALEEYIAASKVAPTVILPPLPPRAAVEAPEPEPAPRRFPWLPAWLTG